MNVEYTKIPDSSFITVEKVRDILKVRVLSVKERKEKKAGVNNILATNAFGEKRLLDRATLLKRYTNPDGSKIRLITWDSVKEHIVVSRDSSLAAGMYIPRGYTLTINSKPVNICKNGNVYIICPLDSNGAISRRHAKIISKADFRKMYRLANAPNISKGSQNRQQLSDVQKASAIDKEIRQEQTAQNIKNDTRQSSNAIKKEMYTAIARILHGDKTIGFVIQGVETKTTREVNLNFFTRLCRERIIDNVTVANREDTGKEYLRGINIKIGDLETVYR